ncbi:hypothetical protein [Enterococcus ureasiticus]|uniref:Uncharacterized protein n=1 Tax=Enterococcus ureasiticus TaxID=903984 RepID=A0A1E5GH19_9ENTE|nr:hypothetical protein [Enterococcus ureasiticus]OEG11979.1 hypothetical protein BCR21_07010 [Enterococcus ureasiticus]
MIDVEDLDFLFNFYEQLNNKNEKKVDLDSFKKENDVNYSFKEDVVEEIQENLKEFKDCIAALRQIDLKDDIHDTVYLYSFVSNMNKLYRIMGNLSISFSDFQDFDIEISKNLPKGPNDDSELI